MNRKKPLMPKATAVWLVENTSLTFDQIAELCDMHLLEVKGIADGEVALGIRGKDPITGGELTREEIQRGETDSAHRLKISEAKVQMPVVKSKRGPRYTPVSRRHDRPNAVLWLLRNHPELKDSQIMRLVGTTKPTIQQIRERSHWNSANLTPQDPVTLGLCSQFDLDAEVKRAAKRVVPAGIGEQPAVPIGETLRPVAETTGYQVPGLGDQPDVVAPATVAQTRRAQASEDARMLERLKQMSSVPKPGDEDQPSEDEVFSGRDQTDSQTLASDDEVFSGGDPADSETPVGGA